jgi:integrase
MREQNASTRRRHPVHALSTRTVKAAKSAGKQRRLADGGGLYLLVAPNGSKSWMLRTVVHGTRRDLGLGSVSLVSLADAREQAHKLRKIARAGEDPLAARRKQRRSVPTFLAAATQVHSAHSAGFRNEKHRKQWLASLAPVFASFGSKPVDSICTADVLVALSPLWLARPETSRRVLQRIRLVFEWCIAHAFTPSDPTVGITKVLPKHRGGRRHHAALPYQQVPIFIEALRHGDASDATKLAFEFTILCATRTSETLLAMWEEIDLVAQTWTIPAIRMKAGVAHRVPLSWRSLAILKAAKPLSNDGLYVFGGRTPGRPLSNMAFLMTLRRLGHTQITAHGFRSSFRDWAAEQTNFSRAVCEAALAHTIRDKTEAAYHRTDLYAQRRELMDLWASFATAERKVAR